MAAAIPWWSQSQPLSMAPKTPAHAGIIITIRRTAVAAAASGAIWASTATAVPELVPSGILRERCSERAHAHQIGGGRSPYQPESLTPSAV